MSEDAEHYTGFPSPADFAALAEVMKEAIALQYPATPQYEDQLPDDMTDAEYETWYEHSVLIYGVRMGPRFERP